MGVFPPQICSSCSTFNRIEKSLRTNLGPLTAGQNESGVAVHDHRIYVVGGYSIWTNEPLACIQVSSSDPGRPRSAGNSDILSTSLCSSL